MSNPRLDRRALISLLGFGASVASILWRAGGDPAFRDLDDPGREHFHGGRALGGVDVDAALAEELVDSRLHVELALGKVTVDVVVAGQDAAGPDLGAPGLEVLLH